MSLFVTYRRIKMMKNPPEPPPEIPVKELVVLLLVILSVIFAERIITRDTNLHQETQIQNTKTQEPKVPLPMVLD